MRPLTLDTAYAQTVVWGVNNVYRTTHLFRISHLVHLIFPKEIQVLSIPF